MTAQQILPLLQGCFAGIVLSLLLWKGWEERVPRLFGGFLLGMTAWGVLLWGVSLSNDPGQAIWWERTGIISIACTWVLFYHFALRYSNIKSWPPPLFGAYLYLIVIIALAPTALIVEGMKSVSNGNVPIHGDMFLLFIIPVYLLVALAIFQLNRARKVSSSYAERNQLLYFILGSLVIFTGGLFYLQPAPQTDMYPGVILANIFFIFLTSIAILRHQLFDIRLATYKVTPYLVMLVLVGSLYMSLYFALHDLWENGMGPMWLHLLFISFIAIGVQPTWERIQYGTTRFFYRGRYEHLTTLDHLQEEAQSISDPSAVTTSLPELIRQSMQSAHIRLLLPSHLTSDFEVATHNGSFDPDSHGSISCDHPVIQWLDANKELLRQNSANQLEGLTANDKQIMEEMAAELFVPLNSGERLVGLLVLGPRVDRQPYSWEDERLLARIASQMALTIENIQLYQASLERERQLAALSRLNRAMSTSLDFQSTYDVFADELKKTIPVDLASIVLGKEDELHFFALSTAIDSLWGKPGTTIPLAGTAAEWVITNKKTFVEPDLISQRRFWTEEIHLEHGLRSMVYLPLFSKGEVIGCFTVGSSKTNAYTRSDIAFLEQVSNQLSLTMENARMYSRERGERARLEAMNKQRDDFFGIISHELKTPLTSIKSSSELLSEELANDKQPSRKRLIENIRRSAGRLETMLNDLLNIAKARSASLELNLHPTDLVPVINNAIDLCIPPIEQKRQSLSIDLPDTLPPVIADPEGFEHILTNLLGNAHKFTPKGGKIQLKVHVNGSKMTMEVTDSGPGIPEEEQELIFEPFYRGEFSAGTVKGMGIGLATVKQMVELHGGTVSAKSNAGDGSTFTVSVPVL